MENTEPERMVPIDCFFNASYAIKDERIILGGYIYLIQEREFVRANEDVYKIGKTKTSSAHARIKQYPKDSVLFYTEAVRNCDEMESLLLNELSRTFKRRTDIGREYFEGDPEKIINTIKNFK